MDHEQHSPEYAGALKRGALPLRAWVELVKPGIVMGNLISAAGGYWLAGHGHVTTPAQLLAILLGVYLVVAAGCVLNNCIDRDIDRKMVRTCHRALALKALPLPAAFGYALFQAVGGLAVLAFYVGALAVCLTAVGLVVYVGFYSLWLKRRSQWGIVVGSLSGAMPPAIGYCAATGQLDTTVALLVITYCVWQLAHSHAIALFNRDDLRAARLPILLQTHAIRRILVYVIAFVSCATGLGLMAGLSEVYFEVISGFAGYWLHLALRSSRFDTATALARKVFQGSLLVIIALNVAFYWG